MKWFLQKEDKKVVSQPIMLRLIDADYEPEDLKAQLPCVITLIREMPGIDRTDYWLAKTEKQIEYNDKVIDYVIVAARFVGVTIKKGCGHVLLGMAYVTDMSLLDDEKLDFNKWEYVAICSADEI